MAVDHCLNRVERVEIAAMSCEGFEGRELAFGVGRNRVSGVSVSDANDRGVRIGGLQPPDVFHCVNE